MKNPDCNNCVWAWDENYPKDKFPNEYNDIMTNSPCGGFVERNYKNFYCNDFRPKREK